MSSALCMDGEIGKRPSRSGSFGPENDAGSQSVLARSAGEDTVAGLRFVGGTACCACAERFFHRRNYMNALTFRFL